MKKIILWIMLLCVFLGAQSVEKYKNGSVDKSEFYKNEQNLQILENSAPSQNLEMPKNSNNEIIIKKYQKWEDLENEWEEKWEKIQK